jgi:hypothetical protein
MPKSGRNIDGEDNAENGSIPVSSMALAAPPRHFVVVALAAAESAPMVADVMQVAFIKRRVPVTVLALLVRFLARDLPQLVPFVRRAAAEHPIARHDDCWSLACWLRAWIDGHSYAPLTP